MPPVPGGGGRQKKNLKFIDLSTNSSPLPTGPREDSTGIGKRTPYLDDVSIATEAITTKMRGARANPLASPHCLAGSLVEVRNRQRDDRELRPSLHHPKDRLGTEFSSFSPSKLPIPCPLPMQSLHPSMPPSSYPVCVHRAHLVGLLPIPQSTGNHRTSRNKGLREPVL